QGSGNAPETGDSLQVYFKNNLGEWILVRAYPGSGVQPFQEEWVNLDSVDAGGGTFYHSQFQLRFRSTGGAGPFPNDDWFIDDVAIGANLINSISDEQAVLPAEYALLPNYPNPFNPSTTIQYDLPQASEITLTIYNMLGQQVRVLVQQSQPVGRHSSVWDGLDADGLPVSSGIYFYRLTARSSASATPFSRVQKMMLMK
ncbi:MAG: T9SS type A sorting domain-containing protein, partial [Calditrichaeota bacterium]|nr:T9SS type A sorting domain-containing protein [Calditrichota bacterium]